MTLPLNDVNVAGDNGCNGFSQSQGTFQGEFGLTMHCPRRRQFLILTSSLCDMVIGEVIRPSDMICTRRLFNSLVAHARVIDETTR
jgi:hypothetical protein